MKTAVRDAETAIVQIKVAALDHELLINETTPSNSPDQLKTQKISPLFSVFSVDFGIIQNFH